jgi:putative flippase GtrA
MECGMKTLGQQIFKFGLIGISASLVHWLTVVIIVESFAIQPLLANIFGFLCSFTLSYQGHSNWTFKSTVPRGHQPLPRFVVVAILGFGLNESLYYLFYTVEKMNYIVGLTLAILLTSICTFVLSKIWAFNHDLH